MKRALAIGRRSSEADHSVRVSGPVWLLSSVKSHRPFGIAHSSRPPATEAGESTQMSVMLARRPCSSVFTGRATSSSE